MESQRLFSDEQIAVIKMPASLRWRTTRHSRMPRKSSSTVCRSRSSCFCRSRNGINTPQWSRQCNICKEPGFLFRSPGFFAFREEFHETQSRRILAATFPRAAAAVAPRSAANDTVQLVSARGSVSVYAVGTHLLAQQRRVYLYGCAEN